MAEIIADKVELEIIGKDGMGKTAIEKINDAITEGGRQLMRDNMEDKAKITLTISMKRVAQGVNIGWELDVKMPPEIRRSIMAFNTPQQGLMTQDTRQMSLVTDNVSPIKGGKDSN